METYPTFFSVLEIFRAQGVVFDDDALNTGAPLNLAQVILIDKYLNLFSLLALQDHSLSALNPYILSCAILTCARSVASLVEPWHPALSKLSGLQSAHFNSVSEALMQQYRDKFDQKNENKGTRSKQERALADLDVNNKENQRVKVNGEEEKT